MKNFANILVALCLALALVAMVSCVDNGSYDDYEETPDLGDINNGEVTDPSHETEPDDAYINPDLSNDEHGWGEIITHSN